MRSPRGAVTIGEVAALLIVVLATEHANGADSSATPAGLPIVLELEGCEAVDQVELSKLLAIEFHTLDVQPAVPRERVHVTCSAQRAEVRLESQSNVHEVELRATAQAVWPRLLALSVSELVTESRARVAKTVAPRATPEPAVLPPEKAPQTVRERERFRAFVGVSLRQAFRPATWLTGLDLGATFELNRYLSLAWDLRLEFGRADTELAKVDWLSASGSFGLLAGGRVGDFRLEAGPGVCIGYLRLSPDVQVANATGHAVSGLWAGPELVARVRYDLGARWFALGSVDAGFASTSVTGLVNGEQRAIDTGGAWGSAMLGTGLLL